MTASLIDAVTQWASSDSGKSTIAVAIAAVAWGEAAAVVGAAYFKGMIPLRAAAISSNVLGLIYGFAIGSLPIVTKHAINLPLNAVRLREMRRLISSVRDASANDLNFEWLKPFMHPANFRETDLVFEKGAEADQAYLVIDGKVEIVERGVVLGAGAIFGEMALFTKSCKRTASARCLTDVRLLAITYEQFEQLYFQNPKFGLYLVRLIVRRFEANHLGEELESS
ncbi:MAG: Crp/Fnr family transcriptional regulator [Methylocystis sp.]|uniref:Crp/Fnr family transcriptional regulator n=1 Tax=Methylocystis sp. TaxID=1911079 RepID=UPI003DA3AB49